MSEKTYFYPKNNLYTKKENELLDSIYATDTNTYTLPNVAIAELHNQESPDFWEGSEDHKSSKTPKSKFANAANLIWFSAGIIVASIIWFFIYQINMHLIMSKAETKIVYQNAPAIVTDKNIDSEVTNSIKNMTEKSSIVSNIPFLSNLFTKKQPEPVQDLSEQEKMTNEDIEEEVEDTIAHSNPATIDTSEVESVPQEKSEPSQAKTGTRFHTIRNGDSLWIIARDYYGNPSDSNIRKIMNANGMKRVNLRLGHKIIIP